MRKQAVMTVIAAVMTGAGAAVTGTGAAAPAGYVPPWLANGQMSVLIDGACDMRQAAYAGLTMQVYLQGRRFAAEADRRAPAWHLVPFGRFAFDVRVDGKAYAVPDAWEQDLDVKAAVVRSTQRYGAVTAASAAFVPMDRNIIAIRRVWTNTGAAAARVRAAFDVVRPPSHPRMKVENLPGRAARQGYACETFGYGIYHTRAAAVAPQPEEFTLEPGASAAREYFFVICDDRHKWNPDALLAKREKEIAELGYAGLAAAHAADWARFWGESEMRVPDAKIQRMLDVAQYHLRINAGPWGMPTGIFQTHWSGKYFAWDAAFNHAGLAATGHFSTAVRAPMFRFRTLEAAKERVIHRPTKSGGALWPWECLEDANQEGSPRGFWLDHIFQLANIARMCWLQYLYTNDLDYLRKHAWPVMLECARYYRIHSVYDDGHGGKYIGKCTDLERLGPAKERAFLTTCGVIDTFQNAVKAAETLGVPDAETAEFGRLAAALYPSLPAADGAYTAYPGATVPSVATFAGLFPFPVLHSTNALQRAAVYRFFGKSREAGNMYPMGKNVCAWYAAKMATAAALLMDREAPAAWLAEAAKTGGLFGEPYEINEPGSVVLRPWFTTASGNTLFAAATMFVSEKDGELRVALGVPKAWTTYAFRLPAFGGLEVELAVRDGKVETFALNKTAAYKPRDINLVLRRSIAEQVRVPEGVTLRVAEE